MNGSTDLPIGSDGKGKLRVKAGQIGEQKVEGVIHYQGPKGIEEHPYSVTYQVMAPLLVASPTKMNVLYRGVKNPVEFSVPGVTAENVRPVLKNGTVSRTADGWVAQVNNLGTAELSASVTMPDGSSKSIGPVRFRVMDLPPPNAIVGGATSTDTKIPLLKLTGARGIVCKLPPWAPFDEPYKVTSFKIVCTLKGNTVEYPVNGAEFDERAKEILQSLKNGDRVWFEDIKAQLVNEQGPKFTASPLGLKVVR